jgi:hypothetical protein
VKVLWFLGSLNLDEILLGWIFGLDAPKNLESVSIYLIREILPKVGQVVAIKHGKTEVLTRFHISP